MQGEEKLFGVGPTFVFTGDMGSLMDLRKNAGVDMHSVNAGSGATATIKVIADATFDTIELNYPLVGTVWNSQTLSGVTIPAGIELVGVVAYWLTSGTIVAYHNK